MFFAPALFRRAPASARSLPPVFASLTAVLLSGCLAALLVPSRLEAQTPGQQDTSFISASVGSTIYALTLQNVTNGPDVFLGGDLDALNQIDGSGVDTTGFVTADFGSPARLVYTIVPELILSGEATPRLLLGGLFGRSSTQVTAGTAAQNIVRLLPDGTLDTTFNPGRGADDYVTAILPLPDGGMVVGGQFEKFNAQSHPHIVRLDHTGAVVDNGVFSSALAFNGTVLSLAAQVNPVASGPQGQILVAGIFSGVNNLTRNHLARLNADGSVDASFNPTFDDRVRVVVSQPDGKILAGGDFVTVNGVAVKHLVRLYYDGSLDTTFNALVTNQPPLFAGPVAVNTITPLGDGRYYIGGNFARINGVTRNYLGRVNADGSVDGFDPGTAIINTVQQVQVDPYTHLVYVGETRSRSVNSVVPPSLIRLFGDPVPLPKVNITAPVDHAGKGDYGQFLIGRTASRNRSALNVYVTLGGNATLKTGNNAGEFKFIPPLTGTAAINGATTYLVTFPANVSYVPIDVKTTKNLAGTRTVTLTVQPDASGATNYTVGKVPAATVTIKR